MNKISVIILTKDSQKHIVKCLKSVYMQKYTDFEVIIVDANSHDHTAYLIYESERNFNGFDITKIILVPSDTTIGMARQIGLESAQGEIIAWIDSDVELPHENWLENMARPLIDTCKDIFSGEIINVAGTQTLSKTKPNDPWILKHLHNSFEYKNRVIDINNYEMVGTGHCLIKRKCIDEVGGFKDVWSYEDIGLTRKIMQRGYSFLYLPEEKVYHYHISGWKDYIKKHIIRNKINVIKRFTTERDINNA